jgi:hypothetical protein
MFGWFKSKAQKEAELKAQVDAYVRDRDAASARAVAAEEKRLAELKEAVRITDEDRIDQLKNSDKPWLCHEVIEVDPADGRVGMKTDWNAAWITYLRSCGFEGDETTMVMKWIAGWASSVGKHSNNDALDLFHTPGYEDVDTTTVAAKKLN